MEARPLSHHSTATTLRDSLAHLEEFRDEPRQRWLSGVVLGMLVALLLSCIGGFILSGLVFGNAINVTGQCASQSFVLFASLLAVPYLALHLRAAHTNFSVIRSQPFQHPLHSWAIIIARLDFLAWSVAVITASVAVAKESEKAHLQLDLAICVLAFLSMTVCLCVVEKATEPFVLPWISPSRTVVCRVSAFVDDIADDSISRRESRGSGKRPAPVGLRPIDNSLSVASEPILLRGQAHDVLPTSSTGREIYAWIEPAPKMPEPTIPPMIDRIHTSPARQRQSTDWKDDWSIFAGEAGLRDSGGSTRAGNMPSCSSTGSASLVPSAPYSVWTPVKPSQPMARSHRYGHGTPGSIPSNGPLLPTLLEVQTSASDVEEYVGRDSGQNGQKRPALEGNTKDDINTQSRKAQVEDVDDAETKSRSLPNNKSSPDKARPAKKLSGQGDDLNGQDAMKIPGSFVDG